jgi:hypothetical protein
MNQEEQELIESYKSSYHNIKQKLKLLDEDKDWEEVWRLKTVLYVLENEIELLKETKGDM